jgi:hypothetical protein
MSNITLGTTPERIKEGFVIPKAEARSLLGAERIEHW